MHNWTRRHLLFIPKKTFVVSTAQVNIVKTPSQPPMMDVYHVQYSVVQTEQASVIHSLLPPPPWGGGSKLSLFSLYGERFLRNALIFKIAIFAHETWPLGKVPPVAHQDYHMYIP